MIKKSIIILSIFYSICGVHETPAGLINEDTMKANTVRILFNERSFNIPTNIFYIMEFDKINGESCIAKVTDYNGAVKEYGVDLTEHGIGKYGFLSHNRAWNNLRLYYCLDKYNQYLYYFYDHSNNIVACSYGSQLRFSFSEDIFYYIIQDWILKKRRHIKGEDFIVDTGVTSFFFSHDEKTLYLIKSDGFLYSMDKQNKNIKHRLKIKGICTEAGIIDANWAWMCIRKNEKSQGNVCFLNLNNHKILKSPLKIQCNAVGIYENNHSVKRVVVPTEKSIRAKD